MKLKKIGVILTLIALIGILGIGSVFAQGNVGFEKKQLTTEQKEELKAKFKETQEKWSKLTEQQKQEIYTLNENVHNAKKSLLDKYSEFGVIDSEVTNQIKEKMTERAAKMKEDGKMPGFGRHGGFNKCRNFKEKAAE